MVVYASGVTMYGAETLRFKGELLIAKDTTKSAPAEECYRNAIEVARMQQARSWQLRATLSFARLLRDTGCREEARNQRLPKSTTGSPRARPT